MRRLSPLLLRVIFVFQMATSCALARSSDSLPEATLSEAMLSEDGGGSYGDSACSGCGQDDCLACQPACFVGPGGRFWAHGEYLGWSVKGMYLPPLVTTAPRGNHGELGQPGTQIIFGDSKYLDEYRSGARVELGTWLNCAGSIGLEGGWFSLADNNRRFTAESSGLLTIARPFLNVVSNQQDSELVGYLPTAGIALAGSGAVSGAVTVDLRSSFDGADLHLLTALCCDPGDACRPARRVNFLVGYRYLRLSEGVAIRENLYSLDPNQSQNGDSTNGNVAFIVQDLFETNNTFHGADIGFTWTCQRERWSLGLLTKLGLGGNRQQVRINGNTTQIDTATGISTTSTVSVPSDGQGNVYTGGGLLAQRTNINPYSREILSLVPELGVTLGYQVNCHWKATAGYTLLGWTNVVRPGDQIDTSVNAGDAKLGQNGLLPDESKPIIGASRPSFAFRDSTLWA
ncbi:MAG: BBP7 family outer membrane beta-barrel protein, partial [Planctomycetota bacterium]|nr:BBP7 family outer membrane beta-barrel protein [Planctomycetota bacterium]